MSLRDWEHLHEESLCRYKVFDVVKARRRSPRTQTDIGFFLIRTPDWVNVVALTDDQQIILVRQYRHGTEQMSLEIPGGLIDPHEQDPAAAAARELREETGYQARHIKKLGVMTPNPAIFTNRCHTYLATGCHRVGDLQQDLGEDIEVVLLPTEQLDAVVRRGEIDHALVLAGLQMWRAAQAE
ncbi:ADP-ribose pyrophosphatase [Planctomycetota bacterium]|jgi:8-oxo-dGTP pyrophosphatase MutT (NUDIX family)|nr:NUDIX hydrolase [Planctomycetota bacterium]MSR38468.1 NUDIX hydrolase [Planctomycetota bacterium]GDY01395.1 ADP-ribose pyrophosphatase [Planctomycetota bacterium]